MWHLTPDSSYNITIINSLTPKWSYFVEIEPKNQTWVTSLLSSVNNICTHFCLQLELEVGLSFHSEKWINLPILGKSFQEPLKRLWHCIQFHITVITPWFNAMENCHNFLFEIQSSTSFLTGLYLHSKYHFTIMKTIIKIYQSCLSALLTFASKSCGPSYAANKAVYMSINESSLWALRNTLT